MPRLKDIRGHTRLFLEDYSKKILRSEMIRAGIVASISFIAMTWFFVTLFIFPDYFPSAALKEFRGISIFAWLALVFVLLGVYEIIFMGVLRMFMKRERKFPLAPRFFNAFIEISTLSLVIFFSSRAGLGIESIFTPTIFLYFIFIALSSLRLIVSLSFFTGFVAAAEYIIMAFTFMEKYAATDQTGMASVAYSPGFHLSRGLILFAAGLVTGFVSYQIKRRLVSSLESIEERKRVLTIFGEHVSPQVVTRLVEAGGEISNESIYVCIMFFDIRNFSSFCENHSAEEVTGLLNYLFEFIVEIIDEHHGMVNKFLGDGFLALFGAPFPSGDDCANAVMAALAIVDRLEEEIRKGFIEPVRVGIGIHAGDVISGNVGSTRRKEYTIIGDVVNIASRLEQLNKKFSSTLLVSGEVWEQRGDISVKGENLGSVAVKGYSAPVPVYRLR